MAFFINNIIFHLRLHSDKELISMAKLHDMHVALILAIILLGHDDILTNWIKS